MRRKIQFLKLFNRISNYNTEIQFELFRWMIATGWNYRIESYFGSQGVFEQVYGLDSVNSQFYWYDHGFNDLEYDVKMRLAFTRAIISDDCLPIVKNWRWKNKINIDSARHLNLKISDASDASITNKLYILFNVSPKKISVQLNQCWPEAINIDYVLLSPNKDEWIAILKYGFDGSSWSHTLAKQGDTTFNDFLTVACTELERITKEQNV